MFIFDEWDRNIIEALILWCIQWFVEARSENYRFIFHWKYNKSKQQLTLGSISMFG